MSFIKKIISIISFNLSFMLDRRKKLNDFDNFNEIIVLNAHTNNLSQEIPKKIWIYWEGKECVIVNHCVNKIRSLNPTYEIFFLNAQTISEFSNINFANLPKITPQLKSDLIRLDLLSNHGGFWLDASIITYESLDWIQNLVIENQTDSFGYYRKKNTLNFNYPVIETWLIATQKNNDFIKAWKHELLKAIELSPQRYIDYVKNNYSNYTDYFQKIGQPVYLCAYIAAQVIMREHSPSMTLINCDQGALRIQVEKRWKKHDVLYDLAIENKPEKMPKLIKLIGKERNLVNKYYLDKKYKPNSLLDEL